MHLTEDARRDHDKRILYLDGGLNFRDLGGYPAAGGKRVRWNQLYRSGTTHLLSAGARERLAEIGIRAAVDLRSVQEQHEYPHALRASAGIDYIAHEHHQVGGNLMQMLADPGLSSAQLIAEMLNVYRGMPYDFAGLFAQLFRSAALGPLPLVFSCAAGKDRTGVAAALLLTALGVDWEDVAQDYLLTEQFVPAITESVLASRAGRRLALLDPDLTAPIFGVDRAYLDAMRAEIMTRSGSFERYFQDDLGLDGGLLESLRGRLLH
jgi:protein-tyrosine phosphatase